MNSPKESKEKKQKKRPTAQKRQIQNEKKRLINKKFMSQIRTTKRSFEDNVTKNKDLAKEQLNLVYSLIDKGVKRGIIKKNAASRVKSRLAAKLAK